VSWGPEWKQSAREYHAARGPGRRLSKAEWELWRHEAGFDDGDNRHRSYEGIDLKEVAP
jgi:hypothetical protein